TYRETLKYLLEQLPMFQRVGAAAYRADLGNITRLCDMLGNPQNDLKCIHVAGTNGKGSVTHITASILQQQGYRVGVFVSPHYKDYRERIKINGKYVSKKFVTRFVEENMEQFKSVDASFFEITTAMAFQYFKEKKVDFAVIETGMGGRLDSTNIITPLLSVITNISLDHQQFLGDTLAKISSEKAGIIKKGIPVVIGETQKETQPVFVKKAKTLGSAIVFADKVRHTKTLFKTDLHGDYQQKNIPTALAAIQELQQQGIEVSEKSIKKGLKNVAKNTSFIGRWMVIGKKPLTIFDSAHNEGGIRELVKGIGNTTKGKLHFVFGTVADKDISNVLALLPKKARYYFCKADIPRGLDASELQKKAAPFKLHGETYPTVKKAYKAARANAHKNDTVLVSGSVFVVAEVV
ncbi:MAG TPA: folylpolyglutamate synthase/dihydrofolate synthase family protein, partial [Chitinophagales bacterium]|nr:folylpolyglutamate synthase/dihydrofolate synthase family protein [Chitinophagales bacterium]